MRLCDVRVLVVEDHEINQQIAEELLKSEGAEVLVATGGRAAIECARSEQSTLHAILMEAAAGVYFISR